MGVFVGEAAVHTFRFGLTNDRKIPAVVVVEPWANDYTAEPGQRIELVVRSASPDLWFNLVSSEDGTTQIYLEGEASRTGVDWDVYVEGAKVEMGHGRRPR